MIDQIKDREENGPEIRDLLNGLHQRLEVLERFLGTFAPTLQDLLEYQLNSEAFNPFAIKNPARKTVAPMPTTALLRGVIQRRRLRDKYFPGDIFADPAWDMILDLTIARIENYRISVTSLCIASAVPPTTALRWISQLTNMGIIERVADPSDGRRAFLSLSDNAFKKVSEYFHYSEFKFDI